eukprot:TRINITY_DN19303_c0_g1_i1.p1 TRINITY_DN19303_c0_g1~~TRINITY_DN19303_c0_g1_i1.p1  ORF type:complete len:428 (+),score=55.55 TRINITY_DN19303_c0_g1_i1:49-1284(+)
MARFADRALMPPRPHLAPETCCAADPLNNNVDVMRRSPQLRRSRSAFGPTENDLLRVWLHYENKPSFFNDVRIATDGGFSDVSNLMSPLRYLWCVIAFVSMAMNVGSLLRADVPLLRNKDWLMNEHDEMILFTDYLLDSVVYWKPYRIHGTHIVALIDLGLVSVLVIRVCVCLLRLLVLQRGPPESPLRAMRQWHTVSLLFWKLIPQFATISAMMPLYFVTPAVFVPDLGRHVERLRDPTSRHSAWPLVKFLVIRACAALVGFDSFMVKFRYASRFATDMKRPALDIVVGSFTFLMQVLGVVQIQWYSKRRLSIFMFGGESGYMSEKKLLRQKTWHAMIARAIWQTLEPLPFLAVMVSFNDYDLQRLALVEFEGLPNDVAVNVNEFELPAIRPAETFRRTEPLPHPRCTSA